MDRAGDSKSIFRRSGLRFAVRKCDKTKRDAKLDAIKTGFALEYAVEKAGDRRQPAPPYPRVARNLLIGQGRAVRPG